MVTAQVKAGTARTLSERIREITALRVGEAVRYTDSTEVNNTVTYIYEGSPSRAYYVHNDTIIRLLDRDAGPVKRGRPTTYKLEEMRPGEVRSFDLPAHRHINVRHAAQRATIATGYTFTAKAVDADTITVTRQPFPGEVAQAQPPAPGASAAQARPAVQAQGERRAVDRRAPEPIVVPAKPGFDEEEF